MEHINLGDWFGDISNGAAQATGWVEYISEAVDWYLRTIAKWSDVSIRASGRCPTLESPPTAPSGEPGGGGGGGGGTSLNRRRLARHRAAGAQPEPDAVSKPEPDAAPSPTPAPSPSPGGGHARLSVRGRHR